MLKTVQTRGSDGIPRARFSASRAGFNGLIAEISNTYRLLPRDFCTSLQYSNYSDFLFLKYSDLYYFPGVF